jgi:DNA-binding MarR family transcriptional regulator
MDGAPRSRRPFDLAGYTPYRIAVLAQRISEQLGAAYACEGLTIPEWRVLAAVSQEPAIAARDVAARTPMDKMAVSRAVASLEEKGLIGRAPATDRRVSALRLTPGGREIFERVASIALSYEDSLLASLSASERIALEKLIARLEEITGRAQVEG